VRRFEFLTFEFVTAGKQCMFQGRLSIGKDIHLAQSCDLQLEVMRKNRAQCARDIANLVDDFSHPKEGLKALQSILALSEQSANLLIRHPSFQYWSRAVKRKSDEHALEFRRRLADELQSIVWAITGVEFADEVSWNVVADYRGGLRALPLGCYIELGEKFAGRKLMLRTADDHVHVLADGMPLCTLQMADDKSGNPTLVALSENVEVVRHPRIFFGACEVGSRDPWLRVRLTGSNQRRDGADVFGVDDLSYNVSRRNESIEPAAQLICDMWPEAARDIATFTSVIVPYWRTPPDNSSFSVGTRQGAIYISEGSPQQVAEALLHENAHVKLRQMQAIDNLLRYPRDDRVTIKVPWRPDPRPLPGVFEGMFVFAHISEFCVRLSRATSVASERARELVGSLRDVYHQFVDKAQMTNEGDNFLNELGVWIEDIRARC